MLRVRLERAERALPLPRIAWLALALWLLAAGVAAALVARGVTDPARLPVSCLFKRATGVPCATCGGTRMAASALRGDLVGAFLLNPFLFAALGALVAWIALRLGFRRRVVVEAPRWAKVGAWSFVIGAFVGNWAMLIVRGV